MRALRLVALAAEVEWFRVRHETHALTRRILWRAGAAGFAAAAVVMLHIAAWDGLVDALGPGVAALFIAMVDALCAAGLLIAGRRRHDRISAEAARSRRALLRAAREENPINDIARTIAGRSAAGAMAGLLADAAVTAVSRRRRARSAPQG